MKRSPVWLERLYIVLLLIVFGGIVLHAPISVGLSTVWPDLAFVIKAWKEILLGFAFLAGVVIITIKGEWGVFRRPLFYAIGAFAVLNILLIPLYFTGLQATLAGLIINLRFLLFFTLVYIALKLFPQYQKIFARVFIAGALVVTGFAMLQVTVLPADFLSRLGYGESTIMPYLTVDQNEAYVRINSTLRGPNPLGAYAVVVMSLLLAYIIRPLLKNKRDIINRFKNLQKHEAAILLVLGVGSVVALWFSYARSAAVAALIAVAIILLVLYGRRINKLMWISLATTALIFGAGVYALKDTQFVSQVILHEDPLEGNDINSNDGHAASVAEGVDRMLRQPLGAGIGSTGSASLLGDDPIIIENQYLFIAHEVGWLGLGLFLYINYLVLAGLWKKRADWFSLGVFASGVGLAVAGLFLPVWADDTVSLIWWGLAAMALAVPVGLKVKRTKLNNEVK